MSYLHFEILGEGKPLVFLHGFLESSKMWSYLDLIQLHRKCIFIDLPGHGKSALLDENEPSILFMATEVKKILDSIHVSDFDVIGHSMGGYVGLELMQFFPGMHKLVLLNSNFWSDSEQKKKSRIQVAEIAWKAKEIFIKTAIPNLFWDKVNHKQEVIELIDEANGITSFAIAYSSLAMRNRTDFTPFVNENVDKIVVIQGENDLTVPVEEMSLAIKDKRNYQIIENCGHMSHIEQGVEVIKILKNALG